MGFSFLGNEAWTWKCYSFLPPLNMVLEEIPHCLFCSKVFLCGELLQDGVCFVFRWSIMGQFSAIWPLGITRLWSTLMIYPSFSGESSGPMSGLQEFPSMEEYPGFCCPLPWSLMLSSMLVHALNTSFISEHLLKEANGIAEAWYFQMDQRDHISKESGHDIGLKNCFWGFENFILLTCISQLQKVIYNDILWLSLMLNDPFVVLLINWEK